MTPTTRIVILAKAPRPGFAKTRLIPALGALGAAKLAQRMLVICVDAALDAKLGPVELHVTPDSDDPAWRGLLPDTSARISDQGEGDLGMRMATAATTALAQEDAVMLVGTDCPELTSPLLQRAAQALRHHDAVIHPTADGGYALLGLRRFSPRLFEDITWSTENVTTTTLSRVLELGWTVDIRQTLHDIDTPDDLRWLPWPP